jgi:acyl-coenzyme A thioesterase PaaI-like protein
MMKKASKLRWLMNWWPPFIGAGIKVETVSEDFRHVRVQLKAGRLRRNYVGTHFGGSLFAMTDPYWMIMIMENLGRDYLVWDKAGEIEFVRAVKEPVWCEFRLDDALLDEFRNAAAGGEKYLRWMPVDVCTADGEVVARVRKQIYVRLKNRNRPE